MSYSPVKAQMLFCREAGLELTTHLTDWYQLPVGVSRGRNAKKDELAHGTVGAVALDRQGHLASATSTGGLFGKRAGRVGDTPLIGAGTWADQSVAVSCTGLGEYFMRSNAAYDVAARMRYADQDLNTASQATISQIGELGGDGGLIALDAQGRVAIAVQFAWYEAGLGPRWRDGASGRL